MNLSLKSLKILCLSYQSFLLLLFGSLFWDFREIPAFTFTTVRKSSYSCILQVKMHHFSTKKKDEKSASPLEI